MHGKYPAREVFDEFFWLYENEMISDGNHFVNKIYEDKIHLNGNYEKVLKQYKETKKVFDSFEDYEK